MKRQLLRRVLPAILLVGSMALIVAACGGSEQTTTSASTASASKATSGGIVFTGLVDYPMTFTALDMDYMDWATITADEPELGTMDYEGVRLDDILTYVGVQPDAQTLVMTALDGTTAEVSLADLPSDALLTIADDDSLNTVMPGLAAAAWVKDVVAMKCK